MRMTLLRLAGSLLGCLIFSVPAVGITLHTGDGLDVTFSDADGAVTAINVDGDPMPLVAGATGGLSVRVGQAIAPYPVQHLSFDDSAGLVVSARNASWDDHGSYVAWLAGGGLYDSGHLLLGDGATEGAGMAMAAPIAVTPGSRLSMTWQARSASTATSHILCVRVYDALGVDITSVANTPAGWGYTGTSQAHAAWGFGCREPNIWEAFERSYPVSVDAASVRVSLRHWTGGDHLLHIDDFKLEVVGGMDWQDRVGVVGSLSAMPGGFVQAGVVPGADLLVDSTVVAADGHLALDVVLQDAAVQMSDRAIELCWTLPVAVDGGQWWDDIATARVIEPGTRYRYTFDHNRHAISHYPFCSVSGAAYGLSMAVPQAVPAVQRFEYDAAAGLRCVWEIGLTPLTTEPGPGRTDVAVALLRHDPAWGFRAAADRYYTLYPAFFEKRTTREGAWMYPVWPSAIPDPLDFGFAFLETWPIDAAERLVCAQHGIGVFYYTEPWIAWQPWGSDPVKPTYEERVARLESWSGPSALTTWLPDGGTGDSGHLLLGDGVTLGAGMATVDTFAVTGGAALDMTWQAQVADTGTTQILCVRLFDAQGSDITASLPAPPGWFWSATSQAHTVAGLANTQADTWQLFSRAYAVSPTVKAMQVSLRHWNGGDHLVHIDDLQVADAGGSLTWLVMEFDRDDGSWRGAQNSDWEDPEPTWLRASRQEAAQAVMDASPLDGDDRYFIDMHPYFWHEWGAGTWHQAWPLNPDPDLSGSGTFDLYREQWILHGLAENDGVYIDSVSAGASVGGWENRRPGHLAVSDAPLTFSWDDGGAAQLAPQAHAEFLTAIAAEVRTAGKLMMLNLFPTASRFHAHNADLMGSEISDLVEPQADSRLRRTMARHRIVSNLLQWGWDVPSYATHEQMEVFIRGQLFWGFYPAVSSAGGLLDGGTPDRYFLHPELYERDRPLFVSYIPVIGALSSAGWEPVTYATVAAGGEIERFGSFSSGDVLLTVRAADGMALDAEVMVDMSRLGGAGACPFVEVRDELAGTAHGAERLAAPVRVRFETSLAPGEVGVYRLVLHAAGDADIDGDVDEGDLAQYEACHGGPNGLLAAPECVAADLDCDGDVDLADFLVVQRCWSGGGVSADPACAD